MPEYHCQSEHGRGHECTGRPQAGICGFLPGCRVAFAMKCAREMWILDTGTNHHVSWMKIHRELGRKWSH
ncbi:MAG: hypothetical protein APR55_02705 [Methanolinea sp. SDB]|nr:MAG: hypothetical protein APR55_02705 [Methanolinea sp. SDB]